MKTLSRAGRQHLRSKVNGVAGIDLPEGTREALADLEAALDTCDALDARRERLRVKLGEALMRALWWKDRTVALKAERRALAERARDVVLESGPKYLADGFDLLRDFAALDIGEPGGKGGTDENPE